MTLEWRLCAHAVDMIIITIDKRSRACQQNQPCLLHALPCPSAGYYRCRGGSACLQEGRGGAGMQARTYLYRVEYTDDRYCVSCCTCDCLYCVYITGCRKSSDSLTYLLIIHLFTCLHTYLLTLLAYLLTLLTVRRELVFSRITS